VVTRRVELEKKLPAKTELSCVLLLQPKNIFYVIDAYTLALMQLLSKRPTELYNK
jgi:hypothetical protein